MEDKISQIAIDSIAEHINQRNNIQYSIPIVGTLLSILKLLKFSK